MKSLLLQNVRAARNQTKEENVKKLCTDVTHVQILGQRESQEDRFFIGKMPRDLECWIVLDGHGGDPCVNFVLQYFPKRLAFHLRQFSLSIKKALRSSVLDTCEAWAEAALGSEGNRQFKKMKETIQKLVQASSTKSGKEEKDIEAKIQAEQLKVFEFVDMENFMSNNLHSGTTFLCVLFEASSGQLFTCHLGDSRAIWHTEGHETILSTTDHDVPKLHVAPHGQKVVTEEGRIKGDLNMSASIGDFTPDMIGLIRTEPAIEQYRLRSHHCTELILASDGLTKVAMDQHRLFLNPHKNAKELLDEMMQEFGEEAFQDNTTILLVKITPL